jgi:hypothetical protein
VADVGDAVEKAPLFSGAFSPLNASALGASGDLEIAKKLECWPTRLG